MSKATGSSLNHAKFCDVCHKKAAALTWHPTRTYRDSSGSRALLLCGACTHKEFLANGGKLKPREVQPSKVKEQIPMFTPEQMAPERAESLDSRARKAFSGR